MKINYLKLFFLLTIFGFTSLGLRAQVRIVQVNPATNAIKLHNYGSDAIDVSDYYLCTLFSYGQLDGMPLISGTFNIPAGGDVTFTSDVDLTISAADLGLYNTNNFGSLSAMEDFTQWGSGGNGRENVAVAKGIWTAGTFISLPPPYEYSGDGNQNGSPFWITSLSLQKNQFPAAFEISPNPAKSYLSLEFYNNQESKQIKVFDVLGKQIYVQNLGSGVFVDINVVNWNKGIYIVKIETESSSQSKRFIKN
ncbi:MAG: hypothetical protein BM564_09610 [Bacteroidetes bacterium MedPE-SWsnd-G2]|nr:MAG: hypothetical protein BM564_09610 [Bacteroidetes bacterium MedPE-SWsnd-G2]